MAVKNQEIETRIIRSRIQLLMKYPFYGTLALNLKLIEEYDVPTAGVDGKNLYYNPDFIKTLTEGELNWVMAHEVMHCALGHIWRRGTRIPEKFNVACDYAIHSILKSNECDDFRMPKDCLYDPKYNNKSSEEIYDMLPNEDENNQNGQGQGQGQGKGNGKGNGQGKGQKGNGQSSGNGQSTLDDHSKWGDSATQEKAQQQAQEWQEKMVNAAEVAEAKSVGSTPGYIKRMIGKIKKPQKNWRQLLAEFVQFEVFDYGFLPPDKRYYGYSDYLMPDYNEETEKLQDIVFVIDTSGSIGSHELTMFYSELVGMMQQFSSSVKGHLIFADADVAAVYDFEDVDDIIKARPAGGGGTNFTPAIKYAMDKKYNNEWDVVGLVYLTDLYGSSSDKDINKDTVPFNVLWVSTTQEDNLPQSYVPEYGQLTYLDLKK